MVLSELSVDDKNGMIDIELTPNANYTFALTNSGYKNLSKKSVDSAAKAAIAGVAEEGSNLDVPDLPNLPN